MTHSTLLVIIGCSEVQKQEDGSPEERIQIKKGRQVSLTEAPVDTILHNYPIDIIFHHWLRCFLSLFVFIQRVKMNLAIGQTGVTLLGLFPY